MELIFIWIIFSFIVGAIGNERSIGFAGAFFLSLFFSPIIGLIVALTSKSKKDEKYKDEMLATQKKQQAMLSKLEKGKSVSIIGELEKLTNMKEKGLITDDEFQKAKEKILNSN